MKRILLSLLAAVCLLRGQAAFPGAIATTAELPPAANDIATKLRLSASAAVTHLYVNDATGMVANMMLTIDPGTSRSEIVRVTAISGTDLTVVRGQDGKTAVAHNAGATVAGYVTAKALNNLNAEVRAIQLALGVGLGNLTPTGGAISTRFAFTAQSPGGSLVAGNNAVTLSPVPSGVNGSNTNHRLYVSGGTGTAEACLITGGDAVSGADSGQLIIQCAYTHSGAWTIASATAGIQEAVYAVGYDGGYIFVPEGEHQAYSSLYIYGNNVNLAGGGSTASRIVFNVPEGTDWITTAFGASGFRVQDIGLYGPVDGSNVPVRATGYAFNGDNNTYMTWTNVRVQNAPFAFRLKNQNIVRLQEVAIRNLYPATGRGVTITGNDTNSLTLERVVIDTDNGPTNQPFSGIQVDSGAEIYLRNCLIMRSGYGLLLAPSASDHVISMLVSTDTTFDHNATAGIAILPTAGAVMRSKFVNTWSASGVYGLRIDPGASAIVRDIGFTRFTAALNSSHGIVIGGGRHISIADSSVGANGTGGGLVDSGIFITKGTGGIEPDDISITNTHFGDTNFTGASGGCVTGYDAETQKYGALLDSTLTYGSLLLAGNHFQCNTVAAISDSATSVSKVITHNTGVDDQPPITVASASTVNLGTSDRTSYFITGTTPIGTMNTPWNGREVELIFTNASPGGVTTGGNFAAAVAATQNVPVRCVYRNSAFWYCK